MNSYVQNLTQIFNAMMEIDVKGNNALIMADCLRALQQTITAMQNAGTDQASDVVSEE